MSNKTFIRITNKDIYDELKTIEKHLARMNGKVAWHTKAIAIIFTIIGIIIVALLS